MCFRQAREVLLLLQLLEVKQLRELPVSENAIIHRDHRLFYPIYRMRRPFKSTLYNPLTLNDCCRGKRTVLVELYSSEGSCTERCSCLESLHSHSMRFPPRSAAQGIRKCDLQVCRGKRPIASPAPAFLPAAWCPRDDGERDQRGWKKASVTC